VDKPRRISVLALLLAAPFLFLTVATFFAPDLFSANANFRNGIRGILGDPDKPFNLRYASTMLFGVPALLLIVRSFFAPKISQSISLAVGALPTSMIVTSIFFGRTDACSMILFGLIALGLVAYGFQPRPAAPEETAPAE